jgi:uncharacterized protein with FMN-binding domain
MIERILNTIDVDAIKAKSTDSEKITELIKAIEVLIEKVDKIIESTGIE